MVRPGGVGGADIGSATIKLVLLDGGGVRFSEYRRHHALAAAHPGLAVRGAVTGSGGPGVSGLLGLTFVQEVVAGTAALAGRSVEVQEDRGTSSGARSARRPPWWRTP